MISLFHAFQGMDEPRAVVTLDHHIAAIKYLVKGDDDHAPDPFPKGKAIENGDEKDSKDHSGIIYGSSCN